jgi:hypothetical protein
LNLLLLMIEFRSKPGQRPGLCSPSRAVPEYTAAGVSTTFATRSPSPGRGVVPGPHLEPHPRKRIAFGSLAGVRNGLMTRTVKHREKAWHWTYEGLSRVPTIGNAARTHLCHTVAVSWTRSRPWSASGTSPTQEDRLRQVKHREKAWHWTYEGLSRVPTIGNARAYSTRWVLRENQ